MCPLTCLRPYYENPIGAPRKADTYVDLPPSRPRKAYSTGKQACASRKLLALHWPFCAGWLGAWTWQHTLLAANMLQYNSLVGAYVQAGSAAGARAVVAGVRCAGVAPGGVAYTPLVDTCVQACCAAMRCPGRPTLLWVPSNAAILRYCHYIHLREYIDFYTVCVWMLLYACRYRKF